MKKILFSCIALVWLTACSHQDIESVDSATGKPVAFAMAVADIGTSANALTSGTLGFAMRTAGTETLSPQEYSRYNDVNKRLEYINCQWCFVDNPLVWRNDTDEVTWAAYYPYSESNMNEDGTLTVTIPADQARDGVYDLLYGSGTTTGAAAAKGIAIHLKHTMTKLLVNVTIGSALGDAEVDSVILTDIATQYQFNVSNLESNIRIGYFMGKLDLYVPINMIRHDDGKTFEAILLPYNPSILGVDIILKDGRKFFYKQANVDFDEGMIHTLDIRVGDDKVQAAPMRQAPWKDITIQ